MSTPTTIAELAVKHDYYCSDHNYYSNEARTQYHSWAAYAKDMGRADEDLNLTFRWDIELHDDEYPAQGYYMQLSNMHQPKGQYWPCHITRVTDEDVPSILEYLNRHWAKMQRIWCPLSVADLNSVPNPVDRRRARQR